MIKKIPNFSRFNRMVSSSHSDTGYRLSTIKLHFNTDKYKMAYLRKTKVSSKLGLDITGKHVLLLSDSMHS